MSKQRNSKGQFVLGNTVRRKRTNKKKAFEIAKAEAEGRIIGEQKAHEKKSLMDSLREHIGKVIDRIDPIELAAVLAGTYVVHEMIYGTEKLLAGVTASIKTSASGVSQIIEGKPVQGTSNFLGGIFGNIANFAPMLAGVFGDLSKGLEAVGNIPEGQTQTQPTIEQQAQIEANKFIQTQDLFVWIVSFVVAYIGIKNAGKIGSTIQDLAGSLGILGIAI